MPASPPPARSASEAGRPVRGTRVLRSAVVLSTIAAVVIVCLNLIRIMRSGDAALPAPAPREERLDSITLERLAAMRGFSGVRSHRLVAVLDPHGREASKFAGALERLGSEKTFNVSVSLYFAPPNAGMDTSALNDILAALCARRQGQLVAFLEALGRGGAQSQQALATLAKVAHIEDVGTFMSCVRRRDTIEEMADGRVLMSRLRLTQLPAVVLDSTVIRGRISVDSIRTRLRAKR